MSDGAKSGRVWSWSFGATAALVLGAVVSTGAGQSGDGEEDAPVAQPGLLAMWTTNASHASVLGHVDWSSDNQRTVEADVNWPNSNEAMLTDGPTDYFALRLLGRIDVPTDGVWYFYLSSDAGARLYIDDEMVINDDANHSFRTRSTMLTLDSGLHDIEIRYLERNYAQGLVLEWQSATMEAKEVVPAEALSHVAADAPADDPSWGIKAYWITNASHADLLGRIDWSAYATTTTERNIAWEITNEAFYAGGPTDYFAVRLCANLTIPETGNWTFELGSDAGARMFIDGELVVYDDSNHSFRFRSGSIALEAGEHAFEVHYLERNYSQGLVATWRGPSDAAAEVIPPGAFTPRNADDAVEVGGLNAYWTTSASHAGRLGQVDWSSYDVQTAVGKVYWPITNAAFLRDGPTDYFAVRLHGQINIPRAGSWTFGLGSDAGAQLLIDGEYVVSDDANHSFRFATGSAALLEGLHDFEVRYLERNYSQGLVATWKGPGDESEEVIPTTALSPTAIDAEDGGGGNTGLRAYWTDAASHAGRLGEVDWSVYDTSTVVERVYFPITNAAFRDDGPTDYFAVRFVGKVVVPAGGSWTFRLGSDAGARLFIDNELVINDDANHSFRFASGEVTLDAGAHDIDVRYLERNYSQGLVLTWQGPTVSQEQVIPASALRLSDDEPVIDAGGGAVRVYWSSNASHARQLGEVDWASYTDMTVEPNVSWRITNSAFFADGPTDYFAARAVGKIIVPRSGNWTFKVGSDAGARLLIDGRLVVNDDANHSFRFSSGEIELEAGEHDFDLRYLERNYSQGLIATWQGPGDAFESVIPSSALRLSADEPVVDEGGGGLRAYWTSGTRHATRLGEVDWLDYTSTALVERISWPITNAAFETDGPTDYFAARFVGKIAIDEAGDWNFKIGSDAGARLLIDGQLVVSDEANHSFRFAGGGIALGVGDHDIEIQYLERNYSQGLVATWQGPSDEYESVIPSSALTPAPLESPGGAFAGSGGLSAEWYSGVRATSLSSVEWSEPSAQTRLDNLSWRITNSAFYEGGPTDYFALRATGTLRVPETGEWTFKIGSDAGAALYIDGELIINDDANHSFRFRTGSAGLEAGAVPFEVRYLERNYSQGLVVTWQGPSDVYEQVIPASAFASPDAERRRVVRWRGTTQHETLKAALAAEVVRRGSGEQLAALRAVERDTIRNMLSLIGARTLRDALGDDAAVLRNLASHPNRD